MGKIGLMVGTGSGLFSGWPFRLLIVLTYRKFSQITLTKLSVFWHSKLKMPSMTPVLMWEWWMS